MRQEAKHAVPSTLDAILNSDILSAPKWFGGRSASTRAEAAQHRIDIMELERAIILEIEQAKSEEEKKSLREMLSDLRSMRRGNTEQRQYH
jgi:hypothetical protein